MLASCQPSCPLPCTLIGRFASWVGSGWIESDRRKKNTTLKNAKQKKRRVCFVNERSLRADLNRISGAVLVVYDGSSACAAANSPLGSSFIRGGDINQTHTNAAEHSRILHITHDLACCMMTMHGTVVVLHIPSTPHSLRLSQCL